LQTAAVAKKLPAKPIRVVYRSASSGTSDNFTNYLRQNVPAIWTKPKNGVIASGNPAGRMPAGSIGAANAQALVTSVKSTKFTIGYSDFSDTVDNAGNPKVGVALLKNANNEFIAPSSASAADDATNFRKVHKVSIAPLIFIGDPSFGSHPKKKYPAALLRVFGSDK